MTPSRGSKKLFGTFPGQKWNPLNAMRVIDLFVALRSSSRRFSGQPLRHEFAAGDGVFQRELAGSQKCQC